MADQATLKKTLSELSKRVELKNKVCADCPNPNPQWASLSFVRSISMDTWTEDQVRRMQLGGNLPFKEFMESYEPADQGGYKPGASPHDTYHCWAAAQYRDKLDSLLAGKEWSPSAPPATFNSGSRSASPAPSAQGLRKSRASARTLGARSESPSPFAASPTSSVSSPVEPLSQKAATENYFASLGKINESRPDNLPPSQGGRYTGFGNTPTLPPNQNPLSSANAPSLAELQENPVAALSKGWSLFAAAVAGATKVVSENVIQPSVEKVTDPNFQATVKGYVSEAQKRAMTVGGVANDWSKHQLGVDVADTVSGVVGTVRDRVAGPSQSGYGHVSMTSPNSDFGRYDGDDDDLFMEYRDVGPTTTTTTTAPVSSATTRTTTSTTPAAITKANSDWDDDWKDF